jgi:hypothetical protein
MPPWQSSCRQRLLVPVPPVIQSVSHFRQFAACQKEGNFWPFSNTRNLLVFNILRWVFTALGTRGQSPAIPACALPLLGANLAPNPARRILVLEGFLLLFIPEYLHRQEPRRSPRWKNRRNYGNSHRYRRNPHPIENARMKGHVGHRVHLRIQWNQMIASRDE